MNAERRAPGREQDKSRGARNVVRPVERERERERVLRERERGERRDKSLRYGAGESVAVTLCVPTAQSRGLLRFACCGVSLRVCYFRLVWSRIRSATTTAGTDFFLKKCRVEIGTTVRIERWYTVRALYSCKREFNTQKTEIRTLRVYCVRSAPLHASVGGSVLFLQRRRCHPTSVRRRASSS